MSTGRKKNVKNTQTHTHKSQETLNLTVISTRHMSTVDVRRYVRTHVRTYVLSGTQNKVVLIHTYVRTYVRTEQYSCLLPVHTQT